MQIERRGGASTDRVVAAIAASLTTIQGQSWSSLPYESITFIKLIH